MRDRVVALAEAAASAAAAGRWQEAERLWTQVRALAPDHPQALYSLGVHAFQRGDPRAALALLQAARAAAPSDPTIPLTVAMVHRQLGASESEWEAIIAALTIDPYFLAGLLAKAEFLEDRRKSRLAAGVYRDALKIAPPEPQWPPLLRQKLAHARQAVEADAQQLFDYLAERVASRRELLDVAQSSRWDEAVAIMAGRSKPYHCECNSLYVPRLPALPFYPAEMFDWIPELESRADAIRVELESLIARDLPGFQPYVAYAAGTPVNQWQQLNHNPAWSSLHLWAHGKPVEENLAQCPQTAAALRQVDAATISGVCPNAMFSALAPHTHIPPHTGETNARLVAHLALIVPDQCQLRVGYERRQWQPGKVMVFDDSIEHEARNDSDRLRVVMIFDVWNPLLSAAEREMVDAMEMAIQAYRQSTDAL
ncbi:MAG: aspartyl/asparaginyl beta-hydroxylase domain-containing protein [Pseudoxanthomonas sp.]